MSVQGECDATLKVILQEMRLTARRRSRSWRADLEALRLLFAALSKPREERRKVGFTVDGDRLETEPEEIDVEGEEHPDMGLDGNYRHVHEPVKSR